MANEERNASMSTMNMFSGKRIDPMKITAKDICLEDIAHALSLLCRGGGHIKYFYSVGQHSINCAREAKARGCTPRLQLACLLHDGSEAYLSDIIRPVKVHLDHYIAIETMIMEKIWERLGLGDLTEQENQLWRQIDDEVLWVECKTMMPGEENIELPRLCSQPDLTEKPWREVEAEFFEMATSLLKERI